MSTLGTKCRTALALGPNNLMRVAWYRAGVRFGFNRACRLRTEVPSGGMFRAPPANLRRPRSCEDIVDAPVGDGAPDWHRSSYSGVTVPRPDRNWWEIPDFDGEVGDIKGVWAASRFEWVVVLAQQARCGNAEALHPLEAWLAEWCRNNPPCRGPNWKCGQEASIRVMHLATAALLLAQVDQAEPALLDLVDLHLARIAPTMSYAIGQDNNHGTSEATALFIGGSWLVRNGRRGGGRWASLGRRRLEEQAARLIAEDGTFSQYSVNYHRVLLDTLSLAEVWRRVLELPGFSERLLARAQAASRWLRSMVQHVNGDAPNIGANDGARLIPLSHTDYRDFRPAVQLATMLFSGTRAYQGHGSWDAPLEWLGVDLEGAPAAPIEPATTFDDGGFAVLRQGDATVIVRYPRFRFRPSQADALHVDLWVAGSNLLRDSGTYSYNTEERWQRYFAGTEGHNTVQFDGRDQMPRLGRFLFGDWLTTQSLVPARTTMEGGRIEVRYRDGCGAVHHRKVLLADRFLRVTDEISGFKDNAVLRWRLAPGVWRLVGSSVSNGTHVLRIESTTVPVRFELTEGWESRDYMEKSHVPVLEVELDRAAVITSEYMWTQ